jgi:Mg2+-importing ATPase
MGSTASPAPVSPPVPTGWVGLTTEEARERQRLHGPNEPGRTEAGSALAEVAHLLSDPLVLILLAASVLAALVGETANAIIITVMVLLSLTLNFVQTYRSRKAIEHLRQRVALTATVLRDGVWQELPRRELVPEDIIRLSSGDLVPADALLLEAHDLHVQEAALTGESLPAEKSADPLHGEEESHRLYLGTSIIGGTAVARVSATGAHTAYGGVVAHLQARAPETELERGMRRFGLLISRSVIFLTLFVFVVLSVFRHEPVESLLFALALAVGLTPEFLPIILTVTLGQGALAMARKHVVVKHLAAIQNLGSVDILCSDKTGTLTTGVMTLQGAVDPSGETDESVLRLAFLNSHFESGIANPMDSALRRSHANPLDEAILQQSTPDLSAYRKLDEIPFDFERRRISIVLDGPEGRQIIAKGAPESLLPACAGYRHRGQNLPWTGEARSAALATYQRLSAQGMRVLAVASRPVEPRPAYSAEEERDLVLAGFVSFLDPPRDDAAAALAELRQDGVDVKIITGDNELVARHICAAVHLDAAQLMLGEEIERLSDPALGARAEEVRVFARVSPAQKNRIILALKRRGHVIGYLGDGINDAPSLHSADVGISVSSAVDVAQDAADIILTRPGLRVLHDGIREGRKAFGNVMKYLFMGTSSNFGNMLSMAMAAVFLPFLPMLPSQILLNNFLYDLAQITIPTDHVDAGFLIKPHRWDMGLLRDFMLRVGPISSLFDFLTFFVLLQIFRASEEMFHTGWFVESLATQTLVLFVIRTSGDPFRTRPSLPLMVNVVLCVSAGILLPYLPFMRAFGFVPLPARYLTLLALLVASYLWLVQWAKVRILGRSSAYAY